MFTASRPVMPWMMKVVFSSTRMDISGARPNLLHRPTGRLRHRYRAVAELDAVFAEDLEPLLLPGAGDAEDGDLLRRVVTRLDDALNDPSRHDIHAGVADHVHDDGDLVHAGLAEDQLGQFGGLADAGVATDLAVVGGAAA